jgi:hypothetical protein
MLALWCYQCCSLEGTYRCSNPDSYMEVARGGAHGDVTALHVRAAALLCLDHGTWKPC